MGNFTQKMNLANFTCKFGEKTVLLDLFDEVVFPAFTSGNVRKYDDASYILLDVALVRFTEQELGITGRLVKNTVVEREQILKNGAIVADHRSMASAPTSFFVLLLSNHKLLYVRENPSAPSLSTFRSTIAYFLANSYRKWTRSVYDLENGNVADDEVEKKRKITWAELRERYPAPSLEITAMSTEQSLSAYVEKFGVINSLVVRVLETNHELDNTPIFGDMREIGAKIGAENITLRTQKSGEKGLEKSEVTKLISAQARDGNAHISLRGKAITGDALFANNDSFNVAIPIQTLPKEALDASVALWNALYGQIGLGIIALKQAPAAAVQKVKALIAARNFE